MPGSPGGTLDWLNVLERHGVAAVREGIQAATPFSPTDAERQEAASEQSRDAELQQIAATYPLPAMDSKKLIYRHTAQGKVKVHKIIAGANGSVYVPISLPFGVAGRLRYLDHADAYGLRCMVQDMSGRPRAVDFDRATLAKIGGAEVRAALFAAGLRTEDDGDMVAVQVLKAADPQREIVIVRRPGWHEVPGAADPTFICPGGSVIGAPDGLDIELHAASRIPVELAIGGSLDGWQQAIETAVSVDGCPHWIICVIAGFAGPLVSLTGLDTCGINLSGMSSSGKSKGQRLAASAWSTPSARPKGLAQSARTTDNAVEAMAQRATGTTLCLDELAHVTGKVAQRMIYTIAGGTGKRRMNADATIRDGYSWSAFAVLSGECSLEEKIRSDGGTWSAGMAVRIVDIDVGDVNRSVAMGTLQNIDRIEDYHGHAGPLFVQKLVEHGLHRQIDALRERVLVASRRIASEAADGASLRAAIPFALLLMAGELAKRFGLIPAMTAVEDAVRWAWQRFQGSSDSLALDPGAHAIASIRAWIAERWDVTIKPVDGWGGSNSREAHGWYDDGAVYIPRDRIREAAGDALKASHIGKVLHERSLLAQRPEADRYTVGRVPTIGKVECYALRRPNSAVPTKLTRFMHRDSLAFSDALFVASLGCIRACRVSPLFGRRSGV